MSPEDRALYRFAPFADGAREKKERKLESFRETFSQLDGSAYMRHFREQGSVKFTFSGGVGQETKMETNSPGQEATSFAATKIRALCLGHEKSNLEATEFLERISSAKVAVFSYCSSGIQRRCSSPPGPGPAESRKPQRLIHISAVSLS